MTVVRAHFSVMLLVVFLFIVIAEAPTSVRRSYDVTAIGCMMPTEMFGFGTTVQIKKDAVVVSGRNDRIREPLPGRRIDY